MSAAQLVCAQQVLGASVPRLATLDTLPRLRTGCAAALSIRAAAATTASQQLSLDGSQPLKFTRRGFSSNNSSSKSELQGLLLEDVPELPVSRWARQSLRTQHLQPRAWHIRSAGAALPSPPLSLGAARRFVSSAAPQPSRPRTPSTVTASVSIPLKSAAAASLANSKPAPAAEKAKTSSENAKADTKGAPPSAKESAADPANSATAAMPDVSSATPPPAKTEPTKEELVQYWEEGAKKPSELLAPPVKPMTVRIQQGLAAFCKGAASFAVASWDVIKNPSKFPPAMAHFWGHMKEELKTYWQGSKLLWHDVKTATNLMHRITQGHTLTRRERRQLIRTASDLFRLVPFALFIIIPFMELLLPVALKLFPNMLPSTFTSQHKREEDLKRQLQLRLHLASFLQDTMANVAQKRVTSDSQNKDSASQLLRLIEDVREGKRLTNEDLQKLAKLFSDDITLDNVGRPQLVNMCKYMGLSPYGTDSLLRFQLRRQMENIKKDDLAIRQEGLDSLSYQELISACRTRGMRTTGLTMAGYKRNLKQWLELSLDMEVPATLLIMSRALAIQEVPASLTPKQKKKLSAAADHGQQESMDQLASALSSMDEEVIEEVLVESGIHDRGLKLEVLERQNQLIAEELQEQKERESLEDQMRQKREELLQKLLVQEKEAKRKHAESEPASEADIPEEEDVSLVEEERKRQEGREIERKIDAELDEIVDDIAIMVNTSALMEEREMLQAEKSKYLARLRQQAEKMSEALSADAFSAGGARKTQKRLFNLRDVLRTLPEYSAAQSYFMAQVHAGMSQQRSAPQEQPAGFDALGMPSEEELRAILDKHQEFITQWPQQTREQPEELSQQQQQLEAAEAEEKATVAAVAADLGLEDVIAAATAAQAKKAAEAPEELTLSNIAEDSNVEELLEQEQEAKQATRKRKETDALSRVENQLDIHLRKMLKKIEEEIEVVDALIGDKLKLLDHQQSGRISFEELTLAVKKHLKSYRTDEEAARVVHRLRDLCEMDDPPFLRGIKKSISVEDVRKVFREADERMAKRQQEVERLEREDRDREIKKQQQQAKKQEAAAEQAASVAASTSSSPTSVSATPPQK